MGKTRPGRVLEDGFKEGSGKDIKFNDKQYDKMIAQKRREKEERLKYIEKAREEEQLQKELEMENRKMELGKRDKKFYDKHNRLPS